MHRRYTEGAWERHERCTKSVWELCRVDYHWLPLATIDLVSHSREIEV